MQILHNEHVGENCSTPFSCLAAFAAERVKFATGTNDEPLGVCADDDDVDVDASVYVEGDGAEEEDDDPAAGSASDSDSSSSSSSDDGSSSADDSDKDEVVKAVDENV